MCWLECSFAYGVSKVEEYERGVPLATTHRSRETQAEPERERVIAKQTMAIFNVSINKM